jgi:hypothetical protein
VIVDTDDLIRSLADDAAAVRRLRPAWVRAAFWLALGLPPLLIIAAIDGIAVEPGNLVGDTRMLVEMAAILLTALTAAVCAFMSTVPGAGRIWFFVPIAPLAVWLASVGEVCVADWMRFGLASLSLRFDGTCFLPMVLMGVLPTAAMLVMLRRGAPLTPRITLVLGTLAVAALANFGLRLVHAADVSIMVLVWNFAVVAILSAIAARRGPRLLDWQRVAAGRAPRD